MGRVFQVFGALFAGLLVFVGLLHGVVLVRHHYTPEALGAFHDWPVLGGFFPKHVEEAVPETADERREKEAASWLRDARNELELPAGFTAEQVETLVRELKDARSQAEAAKTRYEAERADLDRLKKEVEADKQAIHAAADEIDHRVRGLASDRDELERVRTFVRTEEKRNFKTLASMYESMPAEDAAKRLDALDDDSAAKLVAQMSDRKAGRILAAMQTPRAVLITKKLQALSPEGTAATGAAGVTSSK